MRIELTSDQLADKGPHLCNKDPIRAVIQVRPIWDNVARLGSTAPGQGTRGQTQDGGGQWRADAEVTTVAAEGTAGGGGGGGGT